MKHLPLMAVVALAPAAVLPEQPMTIYLLAVLVPLGLMAGDLAEKLAGFGPRLLVGAALAILTWWMQDTATAVAFAAAAVGWSALRGRDGINAWPAYCAASVLLLLTAATRSLWPASPVAAVAALLSGALALEALYWRMDERLLRRWKLLLSPVARAPPPRSR